LDSINCHIVKDSKETKLILFKKEILHSMVYSLFI
jgi:hypothetical protein